MKALIFITCTCICMLYAVASPAFTGRPRHNNQQLLGTKECTWGPSYWCYNITNAKSCGAVKHCIQTVWEHKTLPPDDDSVCDICKKMVKEARDQLESNETQEEIKEVFEGSCKLIPLKTIARECCKIADDFVPELVETLASQMNPQVVCSVAGLCNNPRIDTMLAEAAQTGVQKVGQDDKCEGCHTVVSKVQEKFQKMTRDQVLQGMLAMCGRMGTLSDACTNIVITYFNEIYAHLEQNLNPEEVCLLAGVCTAQFHTHVEITPLSDMGKINVAVQDDLPCELCEQLVGHLRDLLVANTTEEEFKMVLEGLCRQTKEFKNECLDIVDQYYPLIYNFLLSELDANAACVMIGICKEIDPSEYQAPPWVLLPPATADKAKELMSQLANEKQTPAPEVVRITQKGNKVIIDRPELMQLPIERLIPNTLTLVGNTQLCTFCEFFLHYVQEAITTPVNEEKIKEAVERACDKLPATINRECKQFVEMYGNAFVAILAQEIDPSQVCPLLSLCPAPGSQEVEILMRSKSKDKPNCSLCLFAVTELEDMLKNHKTEESIKDALSKLCSHMPKHLATECNDFVETYSDELIEMLIADLNPQEVCVYLKLCDDNSTKGEPALMHKPEEAVNHPDKIMTLTNEIPDNTVEGKIKNISPVDYLTRTPQCVICEYVMEKIESQIENPSNEEEIKKIVHDICNVLPKTVASDCNNFVNQYADEIIRLLIVTMQPSEICSVMGLCTEMLIRITEEISDCAVCETTVSALDHLMGNPKVDHAMEHVLKKACLALPTHYQPKCKSMIDTYGDSFFNLISELANSKAVCEKVGLCAGTLGVMHRTTRSAEQHLVGAKKCTWGPSYWCDTLEKANECSSVSYCQEKVWLGPAPSKQSRTTRDVVPGSHSCTHGPAYWCKNMQNAQECKTIDYCQEKVWLGPAPSKQSRTARDVVPGSHSCTHGPAYWCKNMQNAQECKTIDYCQEKVWLGPAPSKQSRTARDAPGSNSCTHGPAYWCKNMQNAQECNTIDYCQDKVWNKPASPKRRDLVGSKHCTYGPSYWCQNAQTIAECSAHSYCQQHQTKEAATPN